ncbi:type II toxin-antitoxin system RelE/ParE family toxin [Bathymodiolus heckerae thiotrophic gill symbiont]|uniref:type II toxin-antitoxin system RelE/ParE family toxin n=1 Tax=Bathymodiolus heckerae thiotrophic gill symbiont TaxID=1052212 RepID=UPI001485166B|nr:type II toxin-antitoxin system RelE/ParE family toxin [Bathymodiolus heckerae thiotrophic gill symbiont]
MSLKIIQLSKFTKSFKNLAKRYRNIVLDYEKLLDILESNKHNAINLGDNFYKIRLKNSSNPSGKSGSFRVVYFFKTNENEIYLLDIYSKNDVSSISKSKLIQLAKTSHLIQ